MGFLQSIYNTAVGVSVTNGIKNIITSAVEPLIANYVKDLPIENMVDNKLAKLDKEGKSVSSEEMSDFAEKGETFIKAAENIDKYIDTENTDDVKESMYGLAVKLADSYKDDPASLGRYIDSLDSKGDSIIETAEHINEKIEEAEQSGTDVTVDDIHSWTKDQVISSTVENVKDSLSGTETNDEQDKTDIRYQQALDAIKIDNSTEDTSFAMGQ